MVTVNTDDRSMATPVSELVSRAASRVPVRADDGKSGSTFERLEIDGDLYFLKRLSRATDWIMRVTGDHGHRPYRIWQAGIMDQAPACIDHTVVAMEVNGTGDGAELAVLMRDVGPHLVPEGDGVVSLEQHVGFLDHLAELSATFWDWNDTVGELTTMAERVRFFAPDNIAPELVVDDVPGPIAAADAGWKQLVDRSPLLRRVAGAVHDDPSLLSEPLAETPATFLHGDWKMGNLGTHPRGTTILLDWAYPGRGPVCWDLCWYIALNRARLPQPKDDTIAHFRSSLERAGVATEGWWEPQLDLCMIAIMACFGWEKALGDPGELRWWEDRVTEAMGRQGIRPS